MNVEIPLAPRRALGESVRTMTIMRSAVPAFVAHAFFFFRAEDGIRFKLVTGVQTCALPISKIHRRAPRWVPVLVSAVAATLVVYFSIPRARIEPSPILAPTIAFPVPSPTGPELATRKAIHKRLAVPPVQEQAVKWQPSETAVQIAIPAEAMFPPGAMPKGMK